MQVFPLRTACLPVADASEWKPPTSKQASLLLQKLAARLETSRLNGRSLEHLRIAAGIQEELQALRNLIERNVLKDSETLITLRNGVIESICRKKAQMEEERLEAEHKPQDEMEITDEDGVSNGNDEQLLECVRRNEEHTQWILNHKIQSEIENTTFLWQHGLQKAPAKPSALENEPTLPNAGTTTCHQQSHPPATPLHEAPALLRHAPCGLQKPATRLSQLPPAVTPLTGQTTSHQKLKVLQELIVVDGENDQHFLTKLVEAVQKEKYDVAAAAKSTDKASISSLNIAGPAEKSSVMPFKIPTPATSGRLPNRPTAMDMIDRAERGTPGGFDTFMDAFNSNKLNHLKDPKTDKAKLLEGFGSSPAVGPKDSDGFHILAHKRENEHTNHSSRSRSQSRGLKDQGRQNHDNDRRRRSRSPAQTTDHKGNRKDKDNRRHRSKSRGTGHHGSQKNVMDGRRRSQSRGANHHGGRTDGENRRHRSQSRSSEYRGGRRTKSSSHYANHSANPSNNPRLERTNRENREFTPDFTNEVNEWGRHPEDKGSPHWGTMDPDGGNWGGL